MSLSGGSRSSLFCDMCGSMEIVETESGELVCNQCGLVHEEKIYRGPSIYDREKKYFEPRPKRTTKIGKIAERLSNEKSTLLTRLDRLNYADYDYEDMKKERLEREIKRIFSALSLPNGYRKEILKKSIEIYKKFSKGTKYRSEKKIVPLVIYLFFRSECKPLNVKGLIEVSEISRSEFKTFLFNLSDFFKYDEDKKIEIIKNKIMILKNKFSFGEEFYDNSVKLLEYIYKFIRTGTKDVITGVVSSLSLLSLYYGDENRNISVCRLCDEISVQMSAVQIRTQQIFEYLNIEGFSSLVKSKNLIKKVYFSIVKADLEQESTQEDSSEESMVIDLNSFTINSFKIESVKRKEPSEEDALQVIYNKTERSYSFYYRGFRYRLDERRDCFMGSGPPYEEGYHESM